MIVEMGRVRLIAPRDRLDDTLRALQELGSVHLVAPEARAELAPGAAARWAERRERQLRRLVEDAERALELLEVEPSGGSSPESRSALPRQARLAARVPGESARLEGEASGGSSPESRSALPHQARLAAHAPGESARLEGECSAGSSPESRSALPWQAWLVRRVRRQADRLEARERTLDDERQRLRVLERLLEAFPAAIGGGESPRGRLLVLERDPAAQLERLREGLEQLLGRGFELESEALGEGRQAVLLRVSGGDEEASAALSRSLDELLDRAGVRPVSLPPTIADAAGADLAGRVRDRLRWLGRQHEEIRKERAEAARRWREELTAARFAAHDALLELEARRRVLLGDRVFVLEGWVPMEQLDELERILTALHDDALLLERLESARWSGASPPVVLSNPRLFRPFEAITRLLPLPAYGSIDPTPFVAVFFPLFFGLILGDIGYGLALAAACLVLRWRSEPGTTLRSISEMGLACAAFTLIFGALFGELFGDLGHRAFGLRPLAFDRSESIVPFLVLALGIGGVHVVLALILGLIGARRTAPRHALGRGLAAVMVVLVAVALLAAVGVLPAAFFTPTVIVLLALFPILVWVEGVVAPIELLSTLSNVLSYARIMALGTASVMLAIVANRMAGALGSAVVGVLFALLFHLVNFALGVFAPTVHAARLHYVEFFGKFYSPGGLGYRPFARFADHHRAAR